MVAFLHTLSKQSLDYDIIGMHSMLRCFRFLKHGGYSSEVIKPVNNTGMHNLNNISLAKISHAMRWLNIAKL